MALELSGFVLGVIPELRQQFESLQTRLSNFNQGPARYNNLNDTLNVVTKNAETVHDILKQHPGAIPIQTSDMFRMSLNSIYNCLKDSNDMMSMLAQKGMAGSSSGKRRAFVRIVRGVARASSNAEVMSTLETQVDKASNALQSLVDQLSLCLKIDAQQRTSVAANTEANYTYEENTPGLLSTVSLDFETTDANDEPVTPEGKLKRSVLIGTEVTAAAGVIPDAFGVVGMAGVGKTTALQGLAHDEEIRNRFVDGVLYMALGKGATERTVMDGISRIMKTTGATDTDRTIEKCSLLYEAVDCAVKWFKGRVCLFLVDDMWPTDSCGTGYLRELQQLLRSCRQSRMAITTRSKTIALSAGLIVDFDVRAPHGDDSRKIFMKYATATLRGEVAAGNNVEFRSSVSTILSLCAGLPIALSIAGSAVALRVTTLHGDFQSACDSYAAELNDMNRSLADEKNTDGSSLSACIQLSLQYLQHKFAKWKTDNASNAQHSIMDLYMSLCVLANQACIPLSVLSRMWQLDEKCVRDVVDMLCDMSLSKIDYPKHTPGCMGEAGLMIHDLHLRFCKRRARRNNVETLWHNRLLEGYLEQDETTCEMETQEFSRSLHAQTVTTVSCRPWWSESIPKDGYIHGNVARHMSLSGLVRELVSLLLDARWTQLRMEIGGILALTSDFESLENNDEMGVAQGDMKDSLRLILKVIRVSWGRVSEGPSSFLFQVCGRLHSVRRENKIVAAYLNSLEAHTASPYLLPASSFFPNVDRAPVLEIPLGGQCYGVACSPCGRYIAAGGRSCDVVVLDATRGEILERLIGYSAATTSIAFAGPKKIIVGSSDKKVRIWEWESSNKPLQVLLGHSRKVTCVAVSSDTKWIFSGSDDCTMRKWDATSGTQVTEFVQGSSVRSLAVQGDNRTVALGLNHEGNKGENNAKLKVLDSCTGSTIFEDTIRRGCDVPCLAFSPNGSCLAAGLSDGTVRLWDTTTWRRIGESLEGPSGTVFSIAFSPNGQQIASASLDRFCRVWNIATMSTVWVSADHHSSLGSVAFCQDGKRIVSGCGSGIVHVWNVQLHVEEREDRLANANSVLGVAMSPDGLRVACGLRDGTIQFWGTSTGEEVGMSMKGHTQFVCCVAYSQDGRLVSGSEDKTVRLWNPETYSQIGEPLVGHTSKVVSVSFSCDGCRVISASKDRTIRIWNAQSHGLIAELRENMEWRHVAETLDGRFVVAVHRGRHTTIWDRERREVVWKSETVGDDTENEISGDAAREIVLSCGDETPHLWPGSFQSYSGEIFYNSEAYFLAVYSNAFGKKTLLGTLPSRSQDWKYCSKRKIFVAGLLSGAVAICKLIIGNTE